MQLNFAVSALWQQSDAVGIDWRRTLPLQSATSMLLIVAKGGGKGREGQRVAGAAGKVDCLKAK